MAARPLIWHSDGRRGVVASSLCLMLLACSDGGHDRSTPRVADVARIETALASHPCIGALDEWERNYRFAMAKQVFWPASDHPNFDVIEFHYRRAGTVKIAPGRKVVPIGHGDWPDSSSVQAIEGSYVLTSGRLSVGRCQKAKAGSS